MTTTKKQTATKKTPVKAVKEEKQAENPITETPVPELDPVETTEEILQPEETPVPDLYPIESSEEILQPEETPAGEIDSAKLRPEPDESETTDQKVCIVIPYLKSATQGRELLFAARSIAKNFIGEVQLVVIGDKEDWFSDDVLYIDHKCIGDNPQADVIDKIKQLVMDESIPDSFVWSNDDIYFVAPVSLEDIKVLKTAGHLERIPGESGLYATNRSLTIDLLNKHNLPVKNYDIHMPVFYEKENIAELFEHLPELNTEGLLFASVYYNAVNGHGVITEQHDWKTDKWCLHVISGLESTAKQDIFRSLIGTKKFLNHSESGYSNLLMDWIERQFPEKCQFER